MVACLTLHSEVRERGTVRYKIHFWLMWCKNYRNWSRTVKVIAKSLLLLFTNHRVQCAVP